MTNETTVQDGRRPGRLLEVEGLRTTIPVDEGTIVPVDGVDFTLDEGETLGFVGESGCGKSVTAQSILQIVPRPGVVAGSIRFRASAEGTSAEGTSAEDNRPDGNGAAGSTAGADPAVGDTPGTRSGRAVDDTADAHMIDIAKMDPFGAEIRRLRGSEIAMIFQEPMTSFSPVHSIGFQIAEAIHLHRSQDKDEQRRITLELLDWVGIPQPDRVIDAYPMQLSGGMRQRAMIAMALSCNPRLLIADEPTTALDVTVQAQVLNLMRRLKEETGMAIMFITHSLGVIAEMAQRVAVMYLGQIVEYTTVDQLFFDPRHPYTQLLLKSIPKVGRKARVRLDSIAGTVPIPMNLPNRCYFMDRCPSAIPGICDAAKPPLYDLGEGHRARCFLYREHQSSDRAHQDDTAQSERSNQTPQGGRR